MYKSYNYGGDFSKSSIDEYIERVTRLQRMPSVAADYPVETHDDCHGEIIVHVKSLPNRAHDLHKRARDMPKKVYFGEHAKGVEIWRDKGRGEKMIDVEADGYILQKHKNFEMCKYDTFKAS